MNKGQNQQNSVEEENRLLNELTDSLVLDYSTETYQTMIDKVKKYSEILVSGKYAVTTTQLRNIYTSVKKAKKPEELLPLQVKLAYLAGRNESNYRLKALADRLSSLIKNVKTETQMKHFVEFFTALIAYQKYHEKFSSNKH